MAENQIIPARHGVATFVPAGQTIRIINTSGRQVIDTWAFALPPSGPNDEDGGQPSEEEKDPNADLKSASESAKKKKTADLPSQEEAEKTTSGALNSKEEKGQGQQQQSSWSSYVPSLGLTSSSKKDTSGEKDEETKDQKSARSWSAYLPSGQGFSSYIPKTATNTVTSFAEDHKRDPNKSYLEQLQHFSRTPVGATGLAALTGSGYSSSLYAGYQAWNTAHSNTAPMEYMSMQHTRASTLHLRPRVNDKLLTNGREPILTLIEDSSPGVHDTLVPACDPQRYKGLGVEEWGKHGSCAENLMLALKELNERAGLKGPRAVGADVMMNNVPAPLNLFMNVPWDVDGDIDFKAPKAKPGDYVRLKAERDVVVVMSACPQDVLEINDHHPTDAHFVVEDAEPTKQALQRTQTKTPVKKKPATTTLKSNSAPTANAVASPRPVKKSLSRKPIPQKKPSDAQATQGSSKPPAIASSRSVVSAVIKKPVPRPVAPQKKAESTPSAANATSTLRADGAPIERKKPRKLTPRAKPTAASNE